MRIKVLQKSKSSRKITNISDTTHMKHPRLFATFIATNTATYITSMLQRYPGTTVALLPLLLPHLELTLLTLTNMITLKK